MKVYLPCFSEIGEIFHHSVTHEKVSFIEIRSKLFIAIILKNRVDLYQKLKNKNIPISIFMKQSRIYAMAHFGVK